MDNHVCTTGDDFTFNNKRTVSGAGYTSTTDFSTDPKFLARKPLVWTDLRLQDTSPMRDVGTTLSSPYSTVLDPADTTFPNSLTPQASWGSGAEVGAFAYRTDTPPLSVWTSTNWFAGSGQTAWSFNDAFSSGSNLRFSSGGSLTLSRSELLANPAFEVNITGWAASAPQAAPDTVSGLQLWLKADAITGASDGENVASWTDSSGNGNGAVQTISARRPAYRTNVINGKPVVRFDVTTDDAMSGALATALSNENLTLITVFKATPGIRGYLWGFSTAQSGGPIFNNFAFGTWMDQTPDFFRVYKGDGASTNTVNYSNDTTGFNIWAATVTGSTINLFLNNTRVASGAVTGQVSRSFYMLGSLAAAGCCVQSFDGDVAELLVYNRKLTATERSNLEGYLANKYGIVLPSSGVTATHSTPVAMPYSTGSVQVATTATGAYTQPVTVPTTGTYTLEAHALYDFGTPVTASHVRLYYSGATVPTTYTPVGKTGWYKLSASVNAAAGSRSVGVQVSSGKTVRLDDFSFFRTYAPTGTLLSSVFDTAQRSAWTTLSLDASTPGGTSVAVKVRTGSSSTLSDATSFSSCTAISSGASLSTGSCATNGDRYVQYELTLAASDTTQTPTIRSLAVAFGGYATTSLASSLNPSTFGSGVTLTATLTPSSATGTLTFKNGSTTIGTATAGQGSGSITVSNLSVGSHPLSVVYGGNGTYSTATSATLIQVVNKAIPAVALVSATNPSTVGGSVTLTASVTPSAATGTVTFKNGSTTIGTATLGQGSGSMTTLALTAGSHGLTAVYAGNLTYSGSTSNTVTQVVNAAATSSSSVTGTSGGGVGGGGGGGRRTLGPPATASSSTAGGLHSGPDGTDDTAVPQQRGYLAVTIDGELVVFRDVPGRTWYSGYVYDLIRLGIASGYKDESGRLTGFFKPGDPVTGAEALKMALLSAETPLSSGTPRNRSARGDWSAPYVKTAEDLGLSVYAPSLDVRRSLTRGEVVQTLLDAFGVDITGGENPFSDLRASHRHAAAILTAYRLGILTGDTDAAGTPTGTVRPGDPVNRAEVAKIITLLLKRSPR